jgi:hypothetical protein
MADVNMGVLLSTTLKNYRNTLVDNIFKSNAVFNMLKSKGAVKELDGGERIVVPLMYGKNTTAGSYSGYDPLDTTPQTGIDAAEYNWKQYSVSITISGEEERKNNGSKTRIINLLEAKTKQAELSLREALGEGLFSDGTGNGSKDLTGLKAMVDDSGTYGGIASGTYTWWQAKTDEDATTLSIAIMRALFNDCSTGGSDTPDLLVTTQAVYQFYEALLTNFNGNVSYFTPSEDQKKLGDAGFQSLGFKGRPLVWDELCTTGYMYMLNTKHFNLTIHSDANFKVTPFIKPENQDARVAQVLFMGNITCDRRKSHGVAYTIAA